MADTINDGGPAFPQPLITVDGHITAACDHGYGSLSVRDWFAGQALAGNCGFSFTSADGVTADQLAAEAYNIADAMMAQRSK